MLLPHVLLGIPCNPWVFTAVCSQPALMLWVILPALQNLTLTPVKFQGTSVDPVPRFLDSASGLLFSTPAVPPNSVLFAKITNVYLPLGYSGFKHKLHTQNLLFTQSE